MNAAAAGARRARHPLRRQPLAVRTLAKGQRVEIWVFRGEQAVRRHASVGKALLSDAARYGESLLDDAIDDALKALERGDTCSRRLPLKVGA